ncbi:MAG: glutaredoxin 3 [Myxococcales bacterium]|nr:glutaredoxin 3 [Myxococcales bacterium]
MSAPLAKVDIYTTSYCPYCTMAKRLLEKKGAHFEEVDVGDREDLRAWLAEVSGQRTVPQVFVNGSPLGGFSDIASLDNDGKLDALLAVAPAEGDPAVET